MPAFQQHHISTHVEIFVHWAGLHVLALQGPGS
jgi:hypothetical protein